MSTQLKHFINVLEEMFQFDQVDLDFGIYRIMNQKREEVSRFLEKDLIPQVKQAFEKYKGADIETIKEEITKLERQLADMGVPKESSEKYITLQKKLGQGVDVVALENEVFSDLTNFFKRYYHEGDFLSLRRYKKDVYAIPYEGEEVKLHWANADQYYVKSSEHFRDYTFTLPSGKKVHFKLVDANTEQNNNKAQEGKERHFILTNTDPLIEEHGELFIRFEYRPEGGKRTRDKINTETLEKVFTMKEFESWISELQALAPTEKNKKRTLLEKHLNDYTAKNTFDYFIHKDLGGFLRRELDFFIKNEIIHLDDLDTENEKRFEQYISKVKVIKSIGHKIISFLEQLENFQKALWKKKKFVVETNYCITINNIPKEFYSQILENNSQIQEWRKLFSIDDISETITSEFLKENPYLVLDTVHFSEEFKVRLLASFENLDERLDGLLINSDNYHALNLLKRKYESQVDAVYIDPPYNTVHSEILYKNQFKHSSWLSLMANTSTIVPYFWKRQFSFGLAIDDYEFVNLAGLLDTLYPNLERNIVVINHHPQGAGGRLSRTHEYYILLSPPDCPAYLGQPVEDYQEDRSFMRSGTAENNYRYGRWKSFYALLLDPKTNKIVDAENPIPLDEPYPVENTDEGLVRVYPINSKGEERVWRSSYLTGKDRAKNGELIISDKGTVYQTINHEQKREVLFSNWTDSKYNSGTHGSNLLRNMGLGGNFDYPKSINALETALWAQTYGNTHALILDYFAGSGTTAHATINLNRKDKGNRKYILVEMGKHFDTATKPRVQKAIYSKDWKDGKPVSREGSSHMFKYIRLESYEDALNNINLHLSEQQKFAIEENMTPEAREDYMLSYMLNAESEGSASLLDIDMFKNPFEYRMNISNGTETKIQKIDLVETFNYLIGLHVKEMDFIRGFQLIKGHLSTGENVLVIWRNLNGSTNDDLEEFLTTLDINSKDFEYDRIYINGDNHIENLKIDESNWKVVLIEEEFKRLMFDVQDV
ncbi:DNA methyltransferase [Priestia aryabhattai]|uniref:DNA methyltransferase n=1 Tax=Priestia aryabhattai TaxID=412384 RepID=UPI0036C4E5B4